MRLGLRFILIEISIALVTVLATVDVDKARATALLTAVPEFLDLVSAVSSTIDLAIISHYKAMYIYTICTRTPNFAILDHTRAAHREMQGFRGLPGRKNSDRFRCAPPGLQGVPHR